MDGNEGDWGHYELTNLTFQLNLADSKFACFSLGLCVQVKKISIWLKKSTIIKFMKSQIMEFQFAAILKLIKKGVGFRLNEMT